MAYNTVSLLKGVNIGNSNKISMPILCSALTSNGFTNVKSYLNSGNILFESEESIASDERSISDIIKSEFRLDISNIVLKTQTFTYIFDENPYKSSGFLPNLNHIVFLKSMQTSKTESQIQNSGDSYYVGTKAVYLYTPDGYHKSKINSSFWEKRFATLATARNFNTVTKLLSFLNSSPK